MVDALYGELDAAEAREFEAHVASCAACAALFEEMRVTGATMSGRRHPDPGENYWNDYYTRLEARIEREAAVVDGAPIAARRRSYVSWGYRVAAAVAVLAAGVWIGHSMNRSTKEPGISVAHHAQPAPGRSAPGSTGGVALVSADMRARNYIERSQVLLLELINSRPDTTRAGESDYRTQCARAGAMVREASVLRDDLPGSDNRRLRELVTELQLVLREIANLESKNDLQGVQIIRNRVNREGVLLKIDVQQMREDNSAVKTPVKRSGAID